MNAPAQTGTLAASVAHAYLPPSGAGAWVHCAAWPMMNQRYPKPDTQDTLEGNAAHWAFYEMLYARPVAVGQIAPNGVVLNDEMLEAAALYVDVIDDDLARLGIDRRWLQVEQRINIPTVHAENWGTPDTYFVLQYPAAPGGVAHIYLYDFKYGHKFVDAFQNWQCIDYAAGIVDFDAPGSENWRVNVAAIQPRNYDRAGPVRRWSVSVPELRTYRATLRNAAEAAMQPNPVATINDECEHCNGRHACNVLQRRGYSAAGASGQSVPVELPSGALALELKFLKRAQKVLNARISGLEQEAEARLKFKGERMPGYRLEDTYGRETWAVPPEQIIAIGHALGVNVSKPGALTPKQALKLGLNEQIVAAYTTKPKTGVKLVEDDGSAAAKVFGKVATA